MELFKNTSPQTRLILFVAGAVCVMAVIGGVYWQMNITKNPGASSQPQHVTVVNNAASLANLQQTAASSTLSARQRALSASTVSTVAWNSGDLPKAEQYARMATQIDPTEQSGWFDLGITLYFEAMTASSSISEAERDSRIQTSIQYLNKSIAIDPTKPIAYWQLGSELAIVGQTSQALSALTKAQALAQADTSLSTSSKQFLLEQIGSTIDAVRK